MTLWAGNGLFRSTGCTGSVMTAASTIVDQRAMFIADQHIASVSQLVEEQGPRLRLEGVVSPITATKRRPGHFTAARASKRFAKPPAQTFGGCGAVPSIGARSTGS